jgi:hypothetical protein
VSAQTEHIRIRKSRERGHADHGWLDSYFSFSFADYYDPKHMGFRTLRVINEDKVAPGEGFGMHPHRDMEIVSYVVEGELAHKDSMGNGSVIRAGNLQRMSAGTGVTHSEFNPSRDHGTHLLQIWVLPEKKGLDPSYEEINLNTLGLKEGLVLIAGPETAKAPLSIHQDAYLYLGRFSKAATTEHAIKEGRGVWIQMVKGKAAVLNAELDAGDGCAIENTAAAAIRAEAGCEFLLFDLQ